jgi:uncharacterized membrane protein
VKKLLRNIILLPLVSIFLSSAFILAPDTLMAQEDDDSGTEAIESESEELEFDISYGEVTDFGEKDTVFSFETKVTYQGEEEKYFEISSELPSGWNMEVNPGSKAINIPLIKLKPESAETLKLKYSPMVDQKPGDYIFKLILRSTEEGDDLQGSAEFTGIVKPSGRPELLPLKDMLNTEVAPGVDNKYTLVLKNKGTAPVEDITLSSSGEPEGWQVELVDTIDMVAVNEEIEVEVTITPPEKTIAGNYSINFNASSEEGSDDLEIRTIVKVPLIWRITGIGIIAVVITGIAVIFERLGRR